MTEDEIRADERAKCISEIESFACAYVVRWTNIDPQAEDAHKADAWNMLQAAACLRKSPARDG